MKKLMMRKIFLLFSPLLMGLSALFLSCHSPISNHLLEEGVSLELAQWRKQHIDSLSYTLHFSVPQSAAAPVTGHANVCFTVHQPQEVVLDYKGDSASIRTLKVNGLPRNYVLKNEHIVLLDSAVEVGVNDVEIEWIVNNAPLNRHDDFLYTLLVPDRARTLFPCFDQPDMKAQFTLSLDVPDGWTALGNAPVKSATVKDGCRHYVFQPTDSISTYLFSFVVGKWKRSVYKDGKRTISAYYRETDRTKLAQLPEMFRQVAHSIHWMEEYTGCPYPFAKYDFVLVPGFQFGGMEHVGATLYNDREMFLDPHPTPDDQLCRTSLIAHETAHMWFGDLVTMQWFNEVWIKEVMANYFAARIAQPLYPQVNHRLLWLNSYVASALDEDRTQGTAPIQQTLDNLKYAGLIYSQVVYDKAPVVLEKMVNLMGETSFRKAIRNYCTKYAFNNATWDDLLSELQAQTPQNLRLFSEVWVREKGMPTLRMARKDSVLVVAQNDVWQRDVVWPQQMNVTLLGDESDTTLTMDVSKSSQQMVLPFVPRAIIPNPDGSTYGIIVPDSADTQWLLAHWMERPSDTERMSILLTLNELFYNGTICDTTYLASLQRGLQTESSELLGSAIVRRMYTPLRHASQTWKMAADSSLFVMAQNHSLPTVRRQLLRLLIAEADAPQVVAMLYKMWDTAAAPLDESDLTTLSYELALRKALMDDGSLPSPVTGVEADSVYGIQRSSSQILARQRARITNPDRRAQYNYIARAITANKNDLDTLFNSFKHPENRRFEPWTATTLRYINHRLRGKDTERYILPGLEMMEDVQRTGDIFFPRNWVGALLSGHEGETSYQKVVQFLESHPHFPQLLKNKVLQAADWLFRNHSNVQKQ